MFSVAYVILPFSEMPPAEAIRASLAPFQRGRRGDLPEAMLAFHDETDEVRRLYQASFTFTEQDKRGMQIAGDHVDHWNLDLEEVRAEMRRLGLRRWSVRSADLMDLDAFFGRFIRRLERHQVTGAFGMWHNPVGRWDWWDLGGRFDGENLGERRRTERRSVASVSSGPNRGRTILANVENALANALGQEPPPLIDVRSDQNIEMVATLIEGARAGRGNAWPGRPRAPARRGRGPASLAGQVAEARAYGGFRLAATAIGGKLGRHRGRGLRALRGPLGGRSGLSPLTANSTPPGSAEGEVLLPRLLLDRRA